MTRNVNANETSEFPSSGYVPSRMQPEGTEYNNGTNILARAQLRCWTSRHVLTFSAASPGCAPVYYSALLPNYASSL
jgi:hypothetical protein